MAAMAWAGGLCVAITGAGAVPAPCHVRGSGAETSRRGCTSAAFPSGSGPAPISLLPAVRRVRLGRIRSPPFTFRHIHQTVRLQGGSGPATAWPVCTAPPADKPPLRICATPGNLRLAAFAQESATALISYMDEYFTIDYPFGKLDLVAIPDCAAGAMENTGAIFFRESLLLVDPEAASQAVRKRVALVIAHELAHQWFGNLVAMKVGRPVVERRVRDIDGRNSRSGVEAGLADRAR